MEEADDVRSDTSARPTARQRWTYVAARCAAFVLLCTDVGGASRIAGAAAVLLGRCLGSRRRIALENLRAALPGRWEGARGERMVDAVYRGLGRTAAEFVHGPRRMRGKAASRWFRVSGHEAYGGERRVVFVSAHFGNWEHSPAAAATAGFRVASIARPLDNPLLDRWISALRRAGGSWTVAKYGGIRGLLRVAREGHSIGLLMDQGANRHGRLVPFFGRPASTGLAGVILARRLGAPICVGTMLRTAPGRHTLYLDPPLHVEDGREGEDRALHEIQRRLERHILRRPSDWLWLHRRWKVRPEWNLESAGGTP